MSEELARLNEEKAALLELKREKEAREQAEAGASLARTRSAEKAAELAAAKAELASLRAAATAAGVAQRPLSPTDRELKELAKRSQVPMRRKGPGEYQVSGRRGTCLNH
jgi:hypothetical protein